MATLFLYCGSRLAPDYMLLISSVSKMEETKCYSLSNIPVNEPNFRFFNVDPIDRIAFYRTFNMECYMAGRKLVKTVTQRRCNACQGRNAAAE
jgi:hypothetical protein